jgi:hypothetical protein
MKLCNKNRGKFKHFSKNRGFEKYFRRLPFAVCRFTSLAFCPFGGKTS